MGQSLILNIDELAPDQTNAFQTVNDAVAALEQSGNAVLEVDASSPLDPVTILDMLRYAVFRVSGHTGDIDLEFPNEVEISTPIATQRVVAVINEEQYAITVKTTADAGYVVVPAFSSKIILIHGDDARPLAANPPHTIGVYSFGTPGSSDVMLLYAFTEPVEYQDNFLGSIGSIDTNPASSFVMDVNKNGSPIGDITISTGGAYTFTTDAAAELFDIGDILTIVAPSTPDGSAAGIGFTMYGKRV